MKKLRLFDSLKFVVAAIVCTFILNVAHAATLPAGYTELEYIESTGTQYINTGVSLHSNNVVYDFTVIDSEKTTNKSLFGSQTPYSGILNSYGGSLTMKRLFAGSTSGTNIGYTISENKKHHILTLNNGSAELKTDGVVMGTATYSGTVVNNKDIYLFANNGGSNSQYSSYKLFHFAIYDNNILVRNFIPAQQGTTVGLYDTVSGQFFTNGGTGNFVAGSAVSIKIATTKYNEQQFAPVETRLDAAVAAVNTVVTQTMSQAQAIDQIATNKQTRPDEGCDAKYCLLVEDEDGTPHWYPIAGANGVAHALPAGYTELQYIESTGTQYIDTGLKLAAQQTPFLIDIDMSFNDKTGRYLMGFSDSSPAYAGRYSNGTFEINTRYSTIKSGIDEKLNFQYGYFPESNNAIGIKVTKNGESEYLSSGRTSMLAYNTNWYIFANNASNSSGTSVLRGKIYSAKAYKDNELVFNGIPAKNSSGDVGMYDMVSGQFFTNAGTGTFVAGPDM